MPKGAGDGDRGAGGRGWTGVGGAGEGVEWEGEDGARRGHGEWGWRYWEEERDSSEARERGEVKRETSNAREIHIYVKTHHVPPWPHLGSLVMISTCSRLGGELKQEGAA